MVAGLDILLIRATVLAGVDFDCLSEKPVRLIKESFFQMDPPRGTGETRLLLMALPMLIPPLK